MFPILVYVGLEITSQSFRATPARHYPALALSILPALAYLATIPLDMALAGRPPAVGAVGVVQTLRCLANGFIVTSLLWGAFLAALLDGRPIRSALYLLVAGGCALVGIIHSPFAPARVALPHVVVAELPPAARFQSPYWWAAAYSVAALLALGAGFLLSASEAGEVEA
jgi:AGZA family xanthine/uracil permease-like MFS transporter